MVHNHRAQPAKQRLLKVFCGTFHNFQLRSRIPLAPPNLLREATVKWIVALLQWGSSTSITTFWIAFLELFVPATMYCKCSSAAKKCKKWSIPWTVMQVRCRHTNPSQLRPKPHNCSRRIMTSDEVVDVFVHNIKAEARSCWAKINNRFSDSEKQHLWRMCRALRTWYK